MPGPGTVVRPGVRRALGLQLFASVQDEPRSRRPTDIVLAIVSALVVLLAATAAEVLRALDESFSDVVAEIPEFFEPIWKFAFWAPVAWSVVLIVAALVRRRWALGRDLLAAPVVAIVLAAVVAAIVMDDGRGVAELLVDTNGPPVFPPGALVVATAVMSTASPHVSRPFRHLGRWLIALQFLGAVLLGAALPLGAAGAIALGLLGAALVHVTVGSPGGRPTASRIRLALGELGVQVDAVTEASMQPEGVVLFEGEDAGGPLLVKVYGRDAWDAQFLASLWRLAWYRGVERTARLSRLELIEHEAFVTLLAERAGVHVSKVVTAGSAGRGDALVVVRPVGEAIASRGNTAGALRPIDEAAISTLWGEIDRLHDAGISHGRIDLDRVVITPERSLALGDLSSATVAGEPEDDAKDRAQVLALSLLAVGEERAAANARGVLGDDAVLAVLPYLQEAAMPPLIRAALADRKVELDEVRKRLAATLGADEQPLIRLRRVTWGSLLNLALLGFAAFALISLLGDIDLDTFLDDLRDADWWWLAFALLLAQLPRIPSAVSTLGAIERPLPLGPLTTLQFAICYVNLAIPSTAARVAINIRFFERFGVAPTTAVSAGAIDGVSGFIVQIGLFLGLFFWSDLDFGFELDTSDLEGLATIALIVLAGAVVAAVVVLAVPKLRQWVASKLKDARAALRVLRSPTKVLQLFGGNLVSQILFAIALGACVRAFHADVSLSTLVLINTVVSLFAGLLPIPGGMGVSEAGLTLGLTAAGLSSEVAFAVAIAYRFASFYLPPIWGFFCYRWLVKRRYL
jgi:glycosyltransferase 2 family protein